MVSYGFEVGFEVGFGGYLFKKCLPLVGAS